MNIIVIRYKFNTLRPRQNGRHFADDIFKLIFLNENVWISIEISLKFDPQGPINNTPALVQIMAWRRSGDKPLSGPMMVRLPTHICVTQPQWVKIFKWIKKKEKWMTKSKVAEFQINWSNHSFISNVSESDYEIIDFSISLASILIGPLNHITVILSSWWASLNDFGKNMNDMKVNRYHHLVNCETHFLWKYKWCCEKIMLDFLLWYAPKFLSTNDSMCIFAIHHVYMHNSKVNISSCLVVIATCNSNVLREVKSVWFT